MSQETKRPITVEDLLHLKRYEQPTAEFWVGFDQQLRSKQLAALVEKRPWWQRLPKNLGGLRRYALPAGALGALALTAVSLRNYYASTSEVAGEVPAPLLVAHQPLSGESAPFAVAAPVSPIVEAHQASVATPVDHHPVETALVAEVRDAADPIRETVATPEILSIETEGKFEVVASADPLPEHKDAQGFVGLQLAELNLPELLASTSPIADVAMNSVSNRGRVEPLAQMAVPMGSQARLKLNASAIAAVASYFPSGPAEDVTQRQARSLSNDRLYEGPKSRVKANGDRFSWGM